jgi:hypothetical protein
MAAQVFHISFAVSGEPGCGNSLECGFLLPFRTLCCRNSLKIYNLQSFEHPAARRFPATYTFNPTGYTINFLSHNFKLAGHKFKLLPYKFNPASHNFDPVRIFFNNNFL